MRWHVLVAVIALVLLQWCGSLSAEPTTADEALAAVTGWLKLDPAPLDTPLGQAALRVETFVDEEGDPAYYVVYLVPSGFVVVSADDLIEPVIAFADDGVYDPNSENPLGSMVKGDLSSRLAAVRDTGRVRGVTLQAVESATRQEWADLIALGQAPQGGIEAFAASPICNGQPSDVRVSPFTVSKWGQSNTTGGSSSMSCYNFYTPQWNYAAHEPIWDDENTVNFPCGCIAAAMAQLMYYHKHPSQAIGSHQYYIGVRYQQGGELWVSHCYRDTRGGNGTGGAYKWNDMLSSPTATASQSQRSAIGVLCYDAGLSVETHFGAEGSGALVAGANALRTLFQYSNAVEANNLDTDIGPGLTAMVNPNLDARLPVILAIRGPSGGHGVVADGYGYDTTATAYHHLNVGFKGVDDCWYNLPQINCIQNDYQFNTILRCAYNVFPSTRGEIISGRVTDSAGTPLAGALVTADQQAWVSGPKSWSDTTDDKGIFALVGLTPEHSYRLSVQKQGYEFSPRTEAVGKSEDNKAVSGNKWAINFQGTRTGGGKSMRILWDLRHGVQYDSSGSWSPSSGYSHLTAELRDRGYEVGTTSDAGVNFNDLSSWGVLVISVGTAWNSIYTWSEVATIRAFVEAGGGLLIMGDHPRCHNYVGPVALDYGFITGLSESYDGDVTITAHTSHPIFKNCPSIFFRVAGRLGYSPNRDTIVAWDPEGRNVVGVTTAGQGRVVVTGDCDFCLNAYLFRENNRTFIYNVFDWLSQSM